MQAHEIIKKLVVIESPYSGNIERNRDYARAAMVDSLQRGEYPIASHLLYPQVLFESVPAQRELGIQAGYAWMALCDLVAVYNDYGTSHGMQAAVEQALVLKKSIEYRYIGDKKDEQGNNHHGDSI